jgi:fructose-1-phosphate kinase PfkB-like protein
MQPSSQTASISMPAPPIEQARFGQTEDRVYQAVTVAAILLLLGSLWVF